MKNILPFIILLSIVGCTQNESHKTQKANELEQSLFDYIVDPWYPHCLDTVNGGYTADFDFDWKVSESSQEKALVLMTRHIWTLSFLYENYPAREEFLEYAKHGFQFLKSHFWDEEFGGFYYSTTKEGLPQPATIDTKRIYGQAFAINGLAQYYKVSG
ncbi:MAG: AGE family epimerase/isomerase, partial [Bacteroidales bacterium]|nr:AGE family epimerase/isomerase [Bacteroidales bacterium]